MNRSQFSHQFLALFSGTVLAQVFNLASYPLLTRLYSPADFGLFGTFIAASAIPGAIACGRFELAITTAPDEGKRATLWLCFSVALIMSIFSTSLVALWWWHASLPSLGWLAPMFFLAVLLTGVTNASSMFLMRHENFRFASVGVVVRTATTVLLQLGLALLWRSPLGLIVGFCLGLAAQALTGLFISGRTYGIGRPIKDDMRAMFRRFRTQVSVDLPGTLLAALSFNLIPFFMQYLYGIKAVGHFSVGQRIAVLPLQLFNDSLSQVFFQRAARAFEERGEFWQEYRFTLLWSGLISLAMLAGMLFLARPVLAIYLGEGWDLAATILIIMAPMLAIRSVTMSLATTVFVLQRPAWLLYHNMAGVVAIVLAFAFAWTVRASLEQFLATLAILQGLELLIFFAVLTISSRRQYFRQQSIVQGIHSE
ncbi:MAG: lipopolysaccharide biosynthesis protein [Sphingomonadales bacterium]|nr:lipopolysaccharide biosynthesis protein [Sphingomonadales bacterium]